MYSKHQQNPMVLTNFLRLHKHFRFHFLSILDRAQTCLLSLFLQKSTLTPPPPQRTGSQCPPAPPSMPSVPPVFVAVLASARQLEGYVCVCKNYAYMCIHANFWLLNPVDLRSSVSQLCGTSEDGKCKCCVIHTHEWTHAILIYL